MNETNSSRDFDMVAAERCFAPMVDRHLGLYLTAVDITDGRLRNNSIALAKALRAHKIPTVIAYAACRPGSGPDGHYEL